MKYAAACVHVKDEQDIIGEWMAFHRAVGFEHLIIIDNGSTDRTAEIVSTFVDGASVSYLYMPLGQPFHFVDITLKMFGSNFEWMAFIDADEFLFPTIGGDIRNTLCEFEEYAGIGVYWLLYGSSGHDTRPNGLVIDNMTHRAVSDYRNNKHVKSIVRPRKVIKCLGSHIFKLDGEFVDEHKNRLHDGPPYGFYEEATPSHHKLRINHYHVLSREQYKKKALRGYFGDQTKLQSSEEHFDNMWKIHDKNDIQDLAALIYKPLMRFYLEGI